MEEDVECLGASAILSSHGMSEDSSLTVEDFSYICPALLHQMGSKSCIRHGERGSGRINLDHGHSHEGNEHGHSHFAESSSRSATIAWIGGFVAVTIISLPSLMGVIIIPLMNHTLFKFLISFLVALAVGSLSGDAFLHLIPHSQGGHSHSHSHSHAHSHHHEAEDLRGIWLGLTALAGVYFMFLTEHFITLGKMYKEKRLRNKNKELDNQLALEHDTKPVEDVENKGTCHDHTNDGNVAEEEQVMLAPVVAVVTPQGAKEGTFTGDECENKCHSHFHDTVAKADPKHHHHHDYHHILHHHHSQNHHPHTHAHSHSHSYAEQDLKDVGIATLAWMVIMGDGLHNFSDGLAIGAAFSESLSSGLSTSLAVFCHELPHELGDFAVLLKAGMTVRQAVIYNLLSSLTAYLGLIPGILIGQYAENIATWIFALTAGLFLYVALVDMVPEMLHNNEGHHGFSHWGFFLLQNAGILLGFGIMLLIAIYEHSIHLDLGY